MLRICVSTSGRDGSHQQPRCVTWSARQENAVRDSRALGWIPHDSGCRILRKIWFHHIRLWRVTNEASCVTSYKSAKCRQLLPEISTHTIAQMTNLRINQTISQRSSAVFSQLGFKSISNTQINLRNRKSFEASTRLCRIGSGISNAGN